MLKVYCRRNSSNLQKVMWCVGELGIPHERIDAGREFGVNTEDWYLALNPNGKVPLIQDDGANIWESHSIIRYLCAKHGDGGLWPSDPATRSQSDRWMDWMLGTLHTPITVVFFGKVRPAESPYSPEAVAQADRACANHYGLLDAHLKNHAFVAGDEFTMGDIPLGTMTYRWYDMDVIHPDYPNLQRWYDSISSRQAFKDHVLVPIS